jgi:hypothetical protein
MWARCGFAVDLPFDESLMLVCRGFDVRLPCVRRAFAVGSTCVCRGFDVRLPLASTCVCRVFDVRLLLASTCVCRGFDVRLPWVRRAFAVGLTWV